MPPADSHHLGDGSERQPLLVEPSGLSRLLCTESRRPSDHAASIQMSRDGRTMNPICCGETSDAHSALVVLTSLVTSEGVRKV